MVTLPLCHTTPIDNGVEGAPEIECGATTISVVFRTKKAFDGHVFVKGRFDQTQCIAAGAGQENGKLELRFDSCGVKRERTVWSKSILLSILHLLLPT